MAALASSAHAAPTPLSNDGDGAGPVQRLHLRFVGDVMMHEPQIRAGYVDAASEYRYESFFECIRPYLADADWTIGNLETTLVTRNYTGYPCFASPERLARALKWAGFDVMITANNHCLDRLEFGVRNTLDVLDAYGLHHAGTARRPEERDRILLLDKNGIRMAVLAYTEMANGIDKNMDPALVAYLVQFMRPEKIIADIRRARALGAEAVIVFLHWGDEYQRAPAVRQKALADALAAEGADLIIGCHPHVLQPAVWKKTPAGSPVLVAYSLGNFISNQVVRFKDAGAILDVVLEKKPGTARVRVRDAGLIPTWIHLYEVAGQRGYQVLPVQESLWAKSTGWEPMLDNEQVRRLREALADTCSLQEAAGADAVTLRPVRPFPWPVRPLTPYTHQFTCANPVAEFIWDAAVSHLAGSRQPQDTEYLAFPALGSPSSMEHGPMGTPAGPSWDRVLTGAAAHLLHHLASFNPVSSTVPELCFEAAPPVFSGEAELILAQTGSMVAVNYEKERGLRITVPPGTVVNTGEARKRVPVSVETMPEGALRPVTAFERALLARWLWAAATQAKPALWLSLNEGNVRLIADKWVMTESPVAAPAAAPRQLGWHRIAAMTGKAIPPGRDAGSQTATEVGAPRGPLIRFKGIEQRNMAADRDSFLCGADCAAGAAVPAAGLGYRMRYDAVDELFARLEPGMLVLVTRFPVSPDAG